MPRPEVNRSGEMQVFARVVDLGGFSPAARDLRLTPSAVSNVFPIQKTLPVRRKGRKQRQ